MTPPAPDLIGYLNRITTTYGLGADEFLEMFEKHSHACSICRRPLTLFASDLAEAPVVDHDHTTGEVRGILCRGCNTTVGYLEKDRARTRAALQYLKKHAVRGGAKWAAQNRKTIGLLKRLAASDPAPVDTSDGQP